MKYHLPTYEECLNTVNQAGEMLFKETINYVDDYKISMFTYVFAQYEHFEQYKAFEYRGLCFVFNSDGTTLFKRFIKLNKFFNLNEVEVNLLENVKDKTIKEVFNKEDGSLVSFIELPNGKIIASTKKSTNNEQCVICNTMLENNIILFYFVKYCLNKDIVPIFEYVSPFNKIVINYFDSELILLKLRDNNTGEYLDFDVIPQDIIKGIKLVNKENYNDIHELLSLSKTLEDKEGWVITFTDDTMLKLKTEWYFKLHRITTETMNREDYVVDIILNDKLDDVLSVIEKNDVMLVKFINDIKDKLYQFIDVMLIDVNEKKLEFINEHNSNKTSFALKYQKDKYFNVYIQSINGKDEIETIKMYIKKQTSKLSDCRIFLKTI
jgi:T4 RnlA family RNA ligase